MLLYLAADLIWATKIKSTADSLGLPCRPVRSLEMLEARLADQAADPVTALLLDLEKPVESLAMIARLRAPAAADQDRRIHLLAFGPHVAKDLFQQARDAGADEVVPRGAFDHSLPKFLLRLAGHPQ